MMYIIIIIIIIIIIYIEIDLDLDINTHYVYIYIYIDAIGKIAIHLERSLFLLSQDSCSTDWFKGTSTRNIVLFFSIEYHREFLYSFPIRS